MAKPTDPDGLLPLFPTRARAIKGIVASAFVLVLFAFVAVVGGWGYRVLGAVTAGFVIVLVRDWVGGLRRTHPLLFVGDAGVRLHTGHVLGWPEIDGVVVMNVGGQWFGVVPADPAKLDELPFGRRIVRRLDSAAAGWPVWTHLPFASVSDENRQVIDGILTAHAVNRLSPRRGVISRIIRLLFGFLRP